MKARLDLTAKSSEVMSSPDKYYVDESGRVNELEDDEEQILFGTIQNPIKEPESIRVKRELTSKVVNRLIDKWTK